MAEREGRDVARRTAVLPQQAPLRRSGHLHPPPEPRAGQPRARGRGVLRPALPRARPGRDADQGARASTSTASRTRSGSRSPREFRDLVDVEEFLTMCAAGFPEPKTFSTRVARLLRGPGRRLRHRPRQPGPRLRHARHREDGAAADHDAAPPDHLRPPDRPRRPRPRCRQKLTLRRWYGFLRMQGKVARRARKILTPSETSRRDIAADFGVDPARMQVILLGVDDGFVPPTQAAGQGPDPGHGQRRRPDEGHRHPAGGVRQAAHRARRRAGAGHQAARPAAAPSSSSSGSRSRTPSGSSAASARPTWSS